MARESDVAEVEWKILNEIENSQKTSQRGLSRKMNLALGAVNFHLKRLVRKGYIKMKTMPPNRVVYFVTPSGISRKARLTYEYMVGTLAFYREARERSRRLFWQLEQEGIRRVAFLGARDLAEICYLSLQETGVELVGIYDDGRAGEDFLGRWGQAESDRYVTTRDLATYAITKDVEAGRGSPAGGAWLSFAHVPEGELRAASGPVIDRLAANGIDLTRDAVEVSPSSAGTARVTHHPCRWAAPRRADRLVRGAA